MNTIPGARTPAQLSRKGGKPLVSVLISAYNAEPYLQESVDSILAQTEGDFELLLLDDASTDGTLDVMRRIDDSRVRVLRNEKNLGIARSFNRLLDEASGEHIAHMGADDLCMPERLAVHTGILRDDPSVWVASSSYAQFQGDNGIAELPLTNDEIRSGILFYCTLAQGFSLIRGDVFRKNGIRYNEKMTCAIDYDLWCRLIACFPEARFVGTEAILGQYRVHPGQVSTGKRAEQDAMAMKARMHVFRALGIPVLRKEIAVHEHLYHLDMVKEEGVLRQIFDWAWMLKDANEKTRLFEPASFLSILLRRLFEVSNGCLQFRDVSAALLDAFGSGIGLDMKKLFPSLHAPGDSA